jgi:Protein of unknown function (DUF3592)
MDPQLQQSGVFILVIFLAVLAERGWQWLRRRKARSWPVAQGRVHSADWRQPRTGTNRYFLADVSYYYFVDGHFYSGYLRRSFSNADSASQWVKNLLGASIEICYDLQAPWHSMLLEEDLLLHGTPAAELVRGA